MKNFSNKYIFLYSIVLVVVVAVILTVVSVSLKPYQLKNQENENKQFVLGAIGIESTLSTAADLYAQNIKEEEFQGLKYYSFNKDGQEGYIIHFDGKGLQDSIFAFIAFDKNLTITGAKFTHRAETPGLGAKMADPFFAERFIGKKVIDENGNIIPIIVKKNANSASAHEVDAISGGTRTSEGVNNMLVDGISQKYIALFEHLKGGASAQTEADPIESNAAVEMTAEEVAKENPVASDEEIKQLEKGDKE